MQKVFVASLIIVACCASVTAFAEEDALDRFLSPTNRIDRMTNPVNYKMKRLTDPDIPSMPTRKNIPIEVDEESPPPVPSYIDAVNARINRPSPASARPSIAAPAMTNIGWLEAQRNIFTKQAKALRAEADAYDIKYKESSWLSKLFSRDIDDLPSMAGALRTQAAHLERQALIYNYQLEALRAGRQLIPAF
jgi:hypothetical protein